MAVLDGKVYAVGGNDDDGYLSSVERYDPALDVWEAVAPMAEARYKLAVAVLVAWGVDGPPGATGVLSGRGGRKRGSVYTVLMK